jgi:hypothetical protein
MYDWLTKKLKKEELEKKRRVKNKPSSNFQVLVREYLDKCKKCECTGQVIYTGDYQDEYGSWVEGRLKDIRLQECFNCAGTGWEFIDKKIPASSQDRKTFIVGDVVKQEIDLEIEKLENKLNELKKRREDG